MPALGAAFVLAVVACLAPVAMGSGSSPFCAATTSTEAQHLICAAHNDNSTNCFSEANCAYAEPVFAAGFPRVLAGGVYASYVLLEVEVDPSPTVPSFGVDVRCDAFIQGGVDANVPEYWRFYDGATGAFLDDFNTNIVGSARAIVPNTNTITVVNVTLNFAPPTATAVFCSYEEFEAVLPAPFGPEGATIANPNLGKYMVSNAMLPSNTAPTLGLPIPAQNAIPRRPYNFTLHPNTFLDADAGDFVSCRPEVPRTTVEPDGTVIPFTASLPDWLTYDDVGKRFFGTPDPLDTETFTVDMVCGDHFGAPVTDSFAFTVWGIQFLPGLPRVLPGSLDTYSYEVEVAFSPDVVALDGTSFLCAAFTEGTLPTFVHQDSGAIGDRGPVPGPGLSAIASDRGPVDGNGGTLTRRIDVFGTGFTATEVDVYCAFTPDVDWWAGAFPIVSPLVKAVAGAAGGGSGALTGFVPGYPRLRADALTKLSAFVEVLFYEDTRSKETNMGCYALPRGSDSAFDAFGFPVADSVGKFGAVFVPGELITGRVTTGAFPTTDTDIYCAYFDFDTEVWVVSGVLQPALGFLPGYPFIRPDSTAWDTTTVVVNLTPFTRSPFEFVVCHAHLEALTVSFDAFGVPTPPSIAEYAVPLVTGEDVDVVMYTGSYNVSDLEVRCLWKDTEEAWVVSDPLAPALGFSPGYPTVIAEVFTGTTIQVDVLFGAHTGMPFVDSFICWAFLRTQSIAFMPDTTYQATLPCLPTACVHAEPPTPDPAPISAVRANWTHNTTVSQIVVMDTAPYDPPLTKVYCAYFDIERRWVLSEVALPNNAPTVAVPIVAVTTFEAVEWVYAIPATTFNDVDGDALVYEAYLVEDGGVWGPLPDWFAFEPGTQTFTGTPGFFDVGDYVLAVRVTDGPGATAVDVFTLHVVDNRPPGVTVAVIAPDRSDAVGPWTAVVNFTEPVSGFDPSAALTTAAVVPGTLLHVANTTFWFEFVHVGGALDDIVLDAPVGIAVDRADNPNTAAALPVTFVRLDVPSVFPPSSNVLSTDVLALTAGANNVPGMVVFQYSLAGSPAWYDLVGDSFSLDGGVGGVQAEDAIPPTTRVDPLSIALRAAPVETQADVFTPRMGSMFVPSVGGHSTTYDVNEVIGAPTWLPPNQIVLSNTTFTLVAANNDPGVALGRTFQYSPDNATWYDLPSDQLTYDGEVPGLRAPHRLNFSNFKVQDELHFRAVAPRFREGEVTSRELLVNPCHTRCEECYGFSNLQCTRCNSGFFLFEGTTCVDPASCGRGQEANVAERVCKDLPRVLLSTELFTEPPPTTDIGLTRFQVYDGQPQDLPLAMDESQPSSAGVQVFVSLSRAPDSESTVDVQWTEVRQELVVVQAGIAESPVTLMTVFPTILIFTARDWNVPQPFLLKPVDDDTYNGNRVVVLDFTVDSPSFPFSVLHTEEVAVNALITVSITEDDPMELPIDGITSALDRRVFVHEGVAHQLSFTLPRAPTSNVTLHVVVTPVGVAGAGDAGLDLVPGNVTGPFALDLGAAVNFTAADWNVGHPVVLTAADDDVFTNYDRQYHRLDYFFTGADPFYNEATVLPTDVVVSENDAGCPREYTCVNRGTCAAATFPAGNSFDALGRPFAFGGACECFTAFGGRTCNAATFGFIRVNFLMQADILAELDIDFEVKRTWQRLATVLDVCSESVYIVSMENVDSCNPDDSITPLPDEAEIRARQAAGFYDEDGNPVAGTGDAADGEDVVLGPDPFATCSTGSTGADLEAATCVKLVIDLVDKDGNGDVAAAEVLRSRFTQLQLEWSRAGAAAATVTGLDYVAFMQFDAGQYVQEILRTPLPPPDLSLKLKDYTLIMCAVIAGVGVLSWLGWRTYLPYKAYREEQRRLNKKYAPQEGVPEAILRPETMLSPHKDHIKDVMQRTRQREQDAFEEATAPDVAARLGGSDAPQVNPFIGLELAQAKEEAQADKERLWASTPTASVARDTKASPVASPAASTTSTPRPQKPPGKKPRKPPGKKPSKASVVPSPLASARSGSVLVSHDGVPADPSSPLASPSVVRKSSVKSSKSSHRSGGSADRGGAAGGTGVVDDLGRPSVVVPKQRVVRGDVPVRTAATRLGAGAPATPERSPGRVQGGSSPGALPSPPRAALSHDPHRAASPSEEYAMNLLAQKSRPKLPVPLGQQVRRALRLNQKVRSKLMDESEDRPVRDNNRMPHEPPKFL